MGIAQHDVDHAGSKSRPRTVDCGRGAPTTQLRPARERANTPRITLFTKDAELGESIRKAVDASRITIVDSIDAAEHAASAGRCSILITDEALTPRACAAAGERLRRHEPALVMIAVGQRGEDNALIGLLSSGVADRLMLKPVTPALSKIVIESASREHQSRKVRCKVERQQQTPERRVTAEDASVTQPARVIALAGPEPAEPPAAAVEPEQGGGKASSVAGRAATWVVVIVAASAVAGSMQWVASRLAPPQDTQAPSVVDSGALLLADAGRAIDQSRFVDALNALQSARRAGVAEDRIASLDARLRLVLERALTPPPVVPAAEAVSAEEAVVTEIEGSAPTESKVSATVSAPRRVLPVETSTAAISPISAPVIVRNEQTLPVPKPQPVQNNAPIDTHDPAPVIQPAPPPAERKVVRMVKPEYPSEARLRGIEGWTDLSFTVSSAGAVIDPRVEDSSMRQLFARPALAAVRQWKYEPAVDALAPERIKVRVEFRTHD